MVAWDLAWFTSRYYKQCCFLLQSARFKLLFESPVVATVNKMAMCSIDSIKSSKTITKAEVQILKIDRVAKADQPNMIPRDAPRFYALMLTRTKNGKVVQGFTEAVSKFTAAATATTTL
jgi:hypothetical protein